MILIPGYIMLCQVCINFCGEYDADLSASYADIIQPDYYSNFGHRFRLPVQFSGAAINILSNNVFILMFY